MKVTFKTLGCKVNQYETQLIKEQFANSGFEEASSGIPADIYVINTCTVTSKSDAESRRLIRNALKENPSAKIIVTGCYAELDADEIKKIAPNLIIVKNSDKPKILQYLPNGDRHSNIKRCLTPQYDLVSDTNRIEVSDTITKFEGRTKAFVKVQDGCDNFCSYCKVPLVRGRSRSRMPQEIILEISKLVSNGYREIILTGICLGDWGRDLGFKLDLLLNEIERGINGEYRLRLSSIEPWYVTQQLLEKIAASDKICKHLHIPMQSGDDKILGKMNRRLKAGDFVNLINRARTFMPDMAFTTDILVGFPGENEVQFENTLKIIEITRPSRAHIFPFSLRKGTKAELFIKDLAPYPIIRNRISRLKAVTDNLSKEYKRQFEGRIVKVLVETQRDKRTGLLTGFTDTYIKVVFQGPDGLKGALVDLALTNLNSYGILAAHLEGQVSKFGRVFSEDKLDRPLSCNSFNQK